MNYKLIAFDMDGVIFESRNFWMELHKKLGTLKEGKELTKKYLKTDYDRLVREVPGTLWKGKDAKPFMNLIDEMNYHKGVEETFSWLRSKDMIIAIISTSDIKVARRVQKDYGADHLFANELIVKKGIITGEFVWPLGAGHDKRADMFENLASELGIPLEETVFVGDGTSDIRALELAGLGIAFNPEDDSVRKAADVVVEGQNLANIVPELDMICTNKIIHKGTTVTLSVYKETNYTRYSPIVQSYCFCFNKKGELLIGKNPTNTTGSWSIPGGRTEQGENPEETMKRELLEEVDAVCEHYELFAMQKVLYPNNPNKKEGDIFYQARYAGLIKELLPQTPDPDSDLVWERKYVRIEELPHHIYWGDVAEKLARKAWEKIRKHV